MGAPAKESFLELAEQDGLSDDERALKFLRHISVLLLEGKRRPVKCALLPVSAPLPSHASAFLNHLLGVTTPYATVVEVEKNLSETRDQPSEVTSQLRAAHLSLWGVAHIMGIFIMLFASRLYSLEAMADLGMDVIRAEATLRVDDKRVFGADFLKQMDLRRGSQPITELRAMLKDRLMRDRRELQLRLQSLNWLARAVFDSMESHNLRVLFLGEQPLAIVPHSDDTMRVTAQRDDVTVQFDRDDFHLALEHLRSQFNYSAVEEPWHLYVTILFFPMIWVVWAFLFRGGVTQWLVGIEVRRKNGQPAARWQCALRSALVWLPVAGLLCLVVRIDTWSWSYSAAESAAWWLPWAAVVLWWIAIFVLLLYAALALRFPSRGPHDRLAGTWLVPR
jgi:hypothetical protein